MRSRTLASWTFVGLAVAALPAPAVAGLHRPAALRAVAVADGAVDLTWRDLSATEVGFAVERRLPPHGHFTPVAIVAPDATTLRDTGLQAATRYRYRVRALAARARHSPWSQAASVVTQPVPPDTLPPAAPAHVGATVVSCHQADLAWDAATDEGGSGVAGYNVYRDGVRVAFVAAPVTVATDADLPAATTVLCTVTAVDGAGNESAPSKSARVTTPSCPLATTTSTSSTSTSSSTSTTPRRGSTTTTTRPPDRPPVAAAGPDQFTQTLTAVAFSASGSSDPDGTIVAYAWAFGDGATAVGASATHAYAAAGTYTVTLTVTDDAGASASDTAVMHVTNRPPGANAGPDQTAVVGGAVALSSAGSSDADGTIVAYGWAFGDGGVGSGANVSHAYAAAGTYTATLTVTDNAGATARDTAQIVVGAAGGGGAVAWGKRIGSTGYDEAKGIAVDASGSVVVTGEAVGPVDLGGGVTCAGSVFLARYTAAGALLWARCPGSAAGGGGGRGAAVDASGNVFVTGYFRGTVDFGTGALASPNGYDVFLAKYSATGTPLWAKRFGSALIGAIVTESGAAVAVDASGNVFVTGSFEGTADFGTGPLTSAGQGDVFLAKYSPTGAPLWARRFGGPFADEGKAVAVDASGNVVLTGTFYGAVDFGGGALPGAAYDVVLAKYAPNGAPLWSQRFGGALSDEGRGVAIDAGGNVLVTGLFQGTIDLGGGPLASAGGSDAFLAKYTAGGAPLWSRRAGGTTTFDAGNAVAVDASGNVVVAGFFAGSADFGTGPLVSTGSKDAVVARYSAAGAPLWARHFGGAGIDAADAVAVDGSGAVAVAGYYFTAIDVGGGALASAGGADMFLLRLLP